MVFTIEPILTLMDSAKLLMLAKDEFSYVSFCNPSAQWEHMVYIGEEGPEVLTIRPDDTISI